MFRLSEPHGGLLVDRFITEEEAPEVRARAARLTRLTLDDRELTDLELIATGAASPLTGFLGVRDYQSVLRDLRLANGTPWPMPFTLAVSLAQLASVLRDGAAALHDGAGRLLGIIAATDTFVRSAREEAVALYGTADPDHPGVRYLLSRPSGLIGGPVKLLPVPSSDERPATPREVRAAARRRGWSGLIGLATSQGLGCIEGMGPPEGALVGTLRLALRHAPGRDALLHAIVLKNHGAREVLLEYERGDWSGVASRFDGEDLGIVPLLVGGRAAPSRMRSAFAAV